MYVQADRDCQATAGLGAPRFQGQSSGSHQEPSGRHPARACTSAYKQQAESEAAIAQQAEEEAASASSHAKLMRHFD